MEHDPATCYHEAGHAVMALLMGRTIHKVTAVANQLRLGQVEFKKGAAKNSDDWIEAEMMIALAGPLAEARFTGVFNEPGARRDLRSVRKYSLDRVGERQAERYERRIISKTEYHLAESGIWKAVEMIAQELLAKGQISGRAARHLFDQNNSED